jgi:AraC-like DNA-binding protein
LIFYAETVSTQRTDRKQARIQDSGLVSASELMRFHSMPSAGGGISRLVSAHMRELGIQLAPLLSRAGLTVEQIDDRSARLKVRSQIKFLELSAAASQDDFLGFHLARDFDLREIGLLYYVLASSEILADALHKAERYSRIVNEGISLRFSERRETAITFSYVDVERRSDRHQIEFWLTSFVRLCRQLTNRRLVPSQIKVMHNRAKTPAEFKSFLGCEIEFGSNVDEVVFPETVKLMPIGSADPHLNELLIKYCDEALAHRESNRTNLRSSVENAIALLLPHGKARASEIARRLGMSHRTLARRLSSEGLTFSGILDELKVDLAKGYLRDGNLPISQIGWLLGYREVSAFTHAFKRWTGSTPRQSRAQGDLPLTSNRFRRSALGSQVHRRR